MRDVLDGLARVLASGGRGALATVTRTGGSTPQSPGARLLLETTGALVGTVGGGAVERAVIEELRACVTDGKPRTRVWELARDLGMCCGGRMEVFVEPIESNPRLVIFGAGHVAQPTAQMARLVGFDVTVIDARDELNTEERFAGCTRILAEPREAVADLPARETDWFLVVTHDHRADEEALDALLRRSHRYIGVIGSKRKVVRILARIQQRGTLPALDRVYAPVGLAVGAVSPAEIGVSIVSELVALRHGAPAPHLRFVDDPRVRKALAGEIAIESVDD